MNGNGAVDLFPVLPALSPASAADIVVCWYCRCPYLWDCRPYCLQSILNDVGQM